MHKLYKKKSAAKWESINIKVNYRRIEYILFPRGYICKWLIKIFNIMTFYGNLLRIIKQITNTSAKIRENVLSTFEISVRFLKELCSGYSCNTLVPLPKICFREKRIHLKSWIQIFMGPSHCFSKLETMHWSISCWLDGMCVQRQCERQLLACRTVA